MCSIVRNYKGRGIFKCNSIEYETDFSLIQQSDSTIIIKWEHNELIPIQSGSRISMEGTVYSPDGKIKVIEAYVLKVQKSPGTKITMKSLDPVEIIYKEKRFRGFKIRSGLTNFVFRECDELTSGHYGLKLEYDDLNINLMHISDYGEKVKKLEEKKEKILVTSEMEIFSNKSDCDFESVIEDMCYLLSYASRNVIRPIYKDYIIDGDLIKTVLTPTLTRNYNNRDMLIDLDHLSHCVLKEFLLNSYPRYLEFKNKLVLNTVINFYLEAVTFAYMDMGFILSVIALEVLLSGYEEMRKEEGTPLVTGSIKRNEKTIKKFLEDEDLGDVDILSEKIAKEVSYSNLTLHEKLSAFIKDARFELKLNQYEWDFSYIRNKIVHTGKHPKTIPHCGDREIELLEEHNRLIHLEDKIILTILGYKEKPFLNRGNDYEEEILE